MKQLTVISGKGGTGKTTIVAGFASLAKKSVLADCDVDAADLHLILKPEVKDTQEFKGLKIAVINEDKCIKCMKCHESCRFGAINEEIALEESRCEGCGVCRYVCPEDAIKLVDRKSGLVYISETRYGPMAHAILNVGEEASGKLVAEVRNNARMLAKMYKKEIIIIDGPPGIGCPIIAAISGVDLALITTEPTISGIHDLERILGVCEHFNVPAVICVNKYDINVKNTKDIINYCNAQNIDMVGKIPYDNVTTKAMIEGKTVIEFGDSAVSQTIQKIWFDIQKRLMQR